MEMEGSGVLQPDPLHDRPRWLVDCHGLSEDSRRPRCEQCVDEGAGGFGGKSASPRCLPETPADVELGPVSVRHRSDPPKEGVCVIEHEPPRAERALELRANCLGRARPPGDVAHDLGVAVEFDQTVDILRSKRADQEPIGSEPIDHRRVFVDR